jgi:hypothetical protein
VTDRKLQAEIIRRGIELGLYSPAEAVRWSDQAIAAEERPDYALIELSLARHPQEILRHLVSFAEQAEPALVLQGLFRKMLRSLNGDDSVAEQLARTLFRLAHDAEWSPSGLDENDAYFIDDAFDLAASGTWGTRAEAVRELRTFLEEHAADDHLVP